VNAEFINVLTEPLAQKIADRLEGKVIIMPGRPLKVAEAAVQMGISIPHLNVLIRNGKVKACPESPTRISLEEVARMNSTK